MCKPEKNLERLLPVLTDTALVKGYNSCLPYPNSNNGGFESLTP